MVQGNSKSVPPIPLKRLLQPQLAIRPVLWRGRLWDDFCVITQGNWQIGKGRSTIDRKLFTRDLPGQYCLLKPIAQSLSDIHMSTISHCLVSQAKGKRWHLQRACHIVDDSHFAYQVKDTAQVHPFWLQGNCRKINLRIGLLCILKLGDCQMLTQVQQRPADCFSPAHTRANAQSSFAQWREATHDRVDK